jgi:uncharacterized protein with ParB-like and HNH nuclease domain
MDVKSSGFQTPITIAEAVEAIHRRRYLLPAIQREFVWPSEKIIKLFDSLMRDYTIGSLLFWQVDKEKIKDFQFYEFIREYHEKDNKHNPKASVTGEESIVAILDGQQRLTGLYIAMRGSYAEKIPNKRWSSADAFPRKKFYLNLLNKSSDPDLMYDFAFLSSDEANKKDENGFWFEVGKILEFEGLGDIHKFLRDQKLIENEFAVRCLSKLYEVITTNKVINYYLETSNELDKVLQLFIRVNSGGTQLSYSDMLLSIATAQWKTDAREEITSFVDEINNIGDGFEFDKDLVLKSCLVLSDLDVAFKVDNFTNANMTKIENGWEVIKRSLRLAVELVSSFGYEHQSLTSTNAIIPIAYYISKIGCPDNFVESSKYREDRLMIREWLINSLLKRAFSGQPDNVLRTIRKTIQDNGNRFPLVEIVNEFKGSSKSLVFTRDDIEALLHAEYGSAAFSVLAVLYPSVDFNNRFHQDHIFPKTFFKKSQFKKKGVKEDEQEFYLDNYNRIGNLQLLEGQSNEEKSNKDFKEWFEKTYKSKDEQDDFKKRHLIPTGLPLDFANFKEVFEKRNELIVEKLNRVLNIEKADQNNKQSDA